MPSSKFSQRPVPRRRPAICAAVPPPQPAPTPPGHYLSGQPLYRCRVDHDWLMPDRLFGTYGHVDRDPGKPGVENPVLHACCWTGMRRRPDTMWHAQTRFWPPVPGNIDTLLDCYITKKFILSYYTVTIWLWWMWGTGEFTWDWVWVDPGKSFDTGLLTDVVIPGRDYRYAHFEAGLF